MLNKEGYSLNKVAYSYNMLVLARLVEDDCEVFTRKVVFGKPGRAGSITLPMSFIYRLAALAAIKAF